MENASKALVMVGGILVTVLVISLSMYLFSSARDFSNASDERLQQSEILAFNRFFEYYDSTISGLDAYNIIGKINDLNDTHGYEMIHLDTTISSSDIESKPTNTFSNTYNNYSYSYGADGMITSVTIR